ncbi:hypothetical protein O181_049427 [Austropuccinia psidii MF-1]|uniref:Reverse transcriptase Ty1/copia-type domain-containing protein n=1 Tax=Austropuccinia psidii MF-1 TaxID=1389203 RepID=A0A9Q3HML5_9BASI|nr:hypothetical protein [Austropuccinia psidii MF-1]
MGLPANCSTSRICLTNKAHQLPFNDQFDPVQQPLDCVHIDLVGPISPMSISGFRYFLTMKIVISKHVTFDETIYPALKGWSNSGSPLLVPSLAQGAQTVDEVGPALSVVVDEIHPDSPFNGSTLPPHQEGQDALVDEVQHPSPEAELRPPQRIRVIGPQHPTLVSCDLNLENILPHNRRPLALVTSDSSFPKTFKSALNSPDKDLWLAAINKELESMNSLGVWDVVELDPSFKLVGTTWVFKIKKDHLGHITKYKARLCAQGFTQSPGVAFNQTYAPTG